MTEEQIRDAIEKAALRDLADRGMDMARQDICQDCLDRRCKSGKICKEFLRRSKAYAWEMAAMRAILN